MTDDIVPEEPVRHPVPAELLHDLRSPLNQIIGYSELLMEQAQERGSEDSVAHLGKIRAAGYHLLAILEANFLPFRIDSSGQDSVGANDDVLPPDDSSRGAVSESEARPRERRAGRAARSASHRDEDLTP